MAGSPPLASLNSDVRRACHSEEPRGKRGLFALDAATGALRWRVDLGTAPGTHAGTAANADTVFVTEWDAPDGDAANGAPTLRAYDLATGKERWDFAVTGSGDLSKPVGDGTVTSPVSVGDIVLFGVSVRTPSAGAAADAKGLYAFAITTGALRWHAADTEPIHSAPAVHGGTIYTMGGRRPWGDGSGGSLFAFAAA